MAAANKQMAAGEAEENEPMGVPSIEAVPRGSGRGAGGPNLRLKAVTGLLQAVSSSTGQAMSRSEPKRFAWLKQDLLACLSSVFKGIAPGFGLLEVPLWRQGWPDDPPDPPLVAADAHLIARQRLRQGVLGWPEP